MLTKFCRSSVATPVHSLTATMLAAMMRRIERTGGRYVVLVALALLAGLAVWLAGAVRAPPARRSSGCHLRLPIPAGRRGLGKPDGMGTNAECRPSPLPAGAGLEQAPGLSVARQVVRFS